MFACCLLIVCCLLDFAVVLVVLVGYGCLLCLQVGFVALFGCWALHFVCFASCLCLFGALAFRLCWALVCLLVAVGWVVLVLRLWFILVIVL